MPRNIMPPFGWACTNVHCANFAMTVGVGLTSVERPPHYQANGIEAIDVIEAFNLGFRLGNVLKYLLRADRKGAPLEDLKKARWYLEREIQQREQA